MQPNGITIEEVLNRHLSSLLGEEITVTGASRTDSGVHSLGNVAIFDTTTRMPADKISFALNQRLPEDIVVQGSCEVPADWHPRYQNSRKTYEYRILNRTFRMPTRRLDTYFYHHSLDVEKMSRAAVYLEGEHDFKSFCAVNAAGEDHGPDNLCVQRHKSGRHHHNPGDRQRVFVQYGPHYCRDADTGRRRSDRAGADRADPRGARQGGCGIRPHRRTD